MRQQRGLKNLFLLSNKKYLFFIQILTSIIISIIAVMVGQLIKNVVDNGFTSYEIKHLFGKFIFLAVLGTSLTGINTYSNFNYSIDLIEKLRNIVTKKMLNLKYNFYEGEYQGKFNSIISYDIEAIQSYMSGSLVDLINGIFMFLCSFIYLLTVNARITLVCTMSIPITLIFVKIVLNPTYNAINNFVNKMDDANVVVKDTVAGVDIEKSYNLQNVRKEKFYEIMDSATEHYVSYEKVAAVTGSFKYIIKSVPTLICIIMGFINKYQGNITNGEFITFILLLRNLSNPLSELPSYLTEMKKNSVSIGRIEEILNCEEEKFGMAKPETCEKVISFENVDFSYNEEILLFKDLSFEIVKGKKVAIVGPSGGGKSTIFKLITGLYTQQKGYIGLYDTPLSKWDIDKVREEISIVSQDIYLFPDTIEANIAYGSSSANKEKVIEAAKRAYAHDFIMEMQQGYQTMLDERGANLSGGQKQRIAIARSFLKNAPILLLDEMTSALDKESEYLIKKSIDKYSKNKTVIIITHRLSTIENVDEILVIDKGRIVEKGTHEELMSLNGIYVKLNKIKNEGI